MNSLNVEGLKEKRNEIYKKMKETKNVEDYKELDKEYKKIGCKIYHLNNKDNEEYKQMKYNNLKRYLANEEHYNKHTDKNRERNRRSYNMKKTLIET
jgi:seryl-tRNA synthetase